MEEIIANNMETPLVFAILCENIELANKLKEKIINIMNFYTNIIQLPFLTENYENTYNKLNQIWKNYKKIGVYKKNIILNYNILYGCNSNFTFNNIFIKQMFMISREKKTHTFYIDIINFNDFKLNLNIPKIPPNFRTNFDKIYLFQNLENFKELTFDLQSINN